MPTPAKVLVVDDNKEITDLLSRYFLEYKDEFTTISTNHPENAINIMREQKNIQLVISDFKMGAITGLELLIQVKEEFPSVRFIIMTGYGTPELQREAEEQGAVRFLEKPFQIHELVNIIRTTLSEPVKPSGFVGFVDSLQLADIIQFLGVSGGDAELIIEADQKKGSIYFEGGNITHAECGDLVGSEAFFNMFTWRGGNFVVADLTNKVEQTINQSWQGLLMDAAQVEEEITATPTVEVDDDVVVEPEPQIQDDSDALAAFGITDDSKTESAEIEPNPELVHRQNLNILSFKRIENALDSSIDHYMQFFPDSKDPVPVNRLSLSKLPPVLKRHLIFNIHHVSTSVIRTDNVPFDFTKPPVAKAAITLLEVLLESWTISPDDFRQMIGEAISFHIARSIYPIITVANFLETHADNDLEKMKSVLSSLLIKNVIENDYSTLLDSFDEHSEPKVTNSNVINYLQEMWEQRSALANYEILKGSIERLFELFLMDGDENSMAIEQELLVTMLEETSLQNLAEHLMNWIPDPRYPVTVKEIHSELYPIIAE